MTFIPSPLEVEALRQLAARFAGKWRSSLILNVWLASDGGRSHFPAAVCQVLQQLRRNPAFDVATFALPAPAASTAGDASPAAPIAGGAGFTRIEQLVLHDALDALQQFDAPPPEMPRYGEKTT